MGLPDLDTNTNTDTDTDIELITTSDDPLLSLSDTAQKNTHASTSAEAIKNDNTTAPIDIASQQKEVNLHPYRTSTQNYPSMIQRSTTNENHNKPTNPAFNEPDQAPNHATPHKTEKTETDKPLGLAENQLPLEGLESYLQEQEKSLIITALKQTGWNKTQAAELLGTTFRSLRYRMKKLDIAEDQ